MTDAAPPPDLVPPDPVPQPLRIAAALQILSGALSLLVSWWVSSCVIGTACTAATLMMGGQFCGLAPLLLIPLGLIEIGVGVFALLDPIGAAKVQRAVAVLEILAIVLGGVTAAVCGGVTLLLLRREDSVAFLEGGG